jgi:hypothetical protein
MNMFYKKIHRLPIYDSHLFQVIVGDETDKINKAINQNQEDYFASCWRNSHGPRRLKCITIVLDPTDKNNPITAGIITHECVHAKNMLFEKIGFKPKTNNDEAEAYFMEYLVNYVTDFVNKVREKESLLKTKKDE